MAAAGVHGSRQQTSTSTYRSRLNATVEFGLCWRRCRRGIDPLEGVIRVRGAHLAGEVEFCKMLQVKRSRDCGGKLPSGKGVETRSATKRTKLTNKGKREVIKGLVR
jgi:hypothetical protein